MAKITKIEAQKRKGRYNVYLDDRYAFPVAESVLIKFRLMKGLELTKEQVAEITTADDLAKAYQKALDYLSYQLRTEHEVAQRLLEADCTEEQVAAVLRRLREELLVDDQEYANAYVRTVMNTDLKGPGVIRQKLRTKRVGELQIDAALNQFPADRQLENATKLAAKLFNRYRRQPARRQNDKVYQGLITGGYAGDVAKEALAAAKPAPDTAAEDDLLAKEGEKAWRRYARRYQGYELGMRVKQALMRKGFDYDAVASWVADYEEMQNG